MNEITEQNFCGESFNSTNDVAADVFSAVMISADRILIDITAVDCTIIRDRFPHSVTATVHGT